MLQMQLTTNLQRMKITSICSWCYVQAFSKQYSFDLSSLTIRSGINPVRKVTKLTRGPNLSWSRADYVTPRKAGRTCWGAHFRLLRAIKRLTTPDGCVTRIQTPPALRNWWGGGVSILSSAQHIIWKKWHERLHSIFKDYRIPTQAPPYNTPCLRTL